MQQIRRPPRLRVYPTGGKPYDRPAMRGPIDHWHKHWELYTHYRGERIGIYRRLPVLHDAVIAYRLGDGDYLKFGHFVFAA